MPRSTSYALPKLFLWITRALCSRAQHWRGHGTNIRRRARQSYSSCQQRDVDRRLWCCTKRA